MWVKAVIVIAFLGIVASLASGLVYLVRDKGDSRRALKALTWRIGLSVALFAFLIVLWSLGLIEPHGIVPQQPN